MNVIIDTCVWSEALRKQAPTREERVVQELRDLIQENRIVLLGVIRQEVLSGIKEAKHFSRLRDRLRAFEDFAMETEDFELAAEFFNRLRSQGIQGSSTDFLMCALSHRRNLAIFTTDKDFLLYSKHVKIHLHGLRTNS